MHYGQVMTRADLGVIMVAPKAPGRAWSRSTGQSGTASNIALSYAMANGGGHAGIIETNFHEETETGLFGKQALLCCGTVKLMMAGFETLVEAGMNRHGFSRHSRSAGNTAFHTQPATCHY